MNLSTSFKVVLSRVEMSPAWLKHIYSVLCALTWSPKHHLSEYSKLAQKCIRLDTNEWGSAIGNCARNWNLTIRTKGSGECYILGSPYSDEKTRFCDDWPKNKKKKRTNYIVDFYSSGWPHSENQSKWKEELVLRPYQRTVLVDFTVSVDHRVKLEET